jgi:hypothetical protein
LDTFDAFSQRYLREWDKRATVRLQNRYRLPAQVDMADVFPAELQPLARHERVVALGAKAVDEVLVRTMYKWQDDVARQEVEIVAELCGRLAGGAFCFPLPASARQVARTIGVDEFYHAYVAREFIADLAHRTGVDPALAPATTLPLATALADVRRRTEQARRGEAEIMVLCFAENFVTEELLARTKSATEGTAFHTLLREHLIDEGRHQVFFQMLMRHIWQEIDEPDRLALGALLPPFLDAFLLDRSSLEASFHSTLGLIGLDREQRLEIAKQANPAPPSDGRPRKSGMFLAQRIFNLIRVARIDAHGPTRDALVKSGWIEDKNGSG